MAAWEWDEEGSPTKVSGVSTKREPVEEKASPLTKLKKSGPSKQMRDKGWVNYTVEDTPKNVEEVDTLPADVSEDEEFFRGLDAMAPAPTAIMQPQASSRRPETESQRWMRLRHFQPAQAKKPTK